MVCTLILENMSKKVQNFFFNLLIQLKEGMNSQYEVNYARRFTSFRIIKKFF